VQFSSNITYTYQALQTSALIGTTASPAQAQWTYDSWDYVHQTILPGDTSPCGGSGLWPNDSLPTVISTDTFSPTMTYVWEVSKNMRTYYEGNTLPVDVDLGVLLGWTYYPSTGGASHTSQCNEDSPNYALMTMSTVSRRSGEHAR
jgi:hypothetical protein